VSKLLIFIGYRIKDLRIKSQLVYFKLKSKYFIGLIVFKMIFRKHDNIHSFRNMTILNTYLKNFLIIETQLHLVTWVENVVY